MMYKNNFALAIKKGGQTLRESQQNGRSVVFLPFESEYSVYVKNNNSRRALLKLSVDGMDVGAEFIISEFGCLDLERLVLDGDLSKGCRFKFVSVNDSRVQDPSGPDNGIVRAELWLEGPDYTIQPMGFGDSMLRGVSDSQISAQNCSFMSASTGLSGDAGATVEGSESHQQFYTGDFGQRQYPSTVMELLIRGSKTAVTVRNTRRTQCPNCNRKARHRDRYCPNCGTNLVRPVYS